MIRLFELLPGITLRCFPDRRFQQSCISIQIVRPMCREEAARNALLPAVLLRGSARYPDLRCISLHLDDLYGADVGALVRRIGDYQTTGLACSFLEDRCTLEQTPLLPQVIDFLSELLRNPCMLPEYVESEKQNLIDAMDARINDKRIYAGDRLMALVCGQDSFGIPRLGQREQVSRITARTLSAHYRRILRESRIDCFYVGSREPEQVAALLKPIFAHISRCYQPLPPQTPLRPGDFREMREEMAVAQGKLCMGFTTPITIRDPEFAAMQVLNTLLGAGMNSKLFTQIRERLSLCYDIGTTYYGSKGIVTVSAGIDTCRQEQVQDKVLSLLADCCEGRITEAELEGAKQTLISGLLGVHDAPSSIENYYATAALSGLPLSPEQYRQAVQAVSKDQVAAVAGTLACQAIYFLARMEKC